MPPTPTVTAVLRPPGGAGQKPEEQRAILAARRLVSHKQRVPLDKVGFVSIKPKQWPNTALGCPKPGMFYAQHVTPGYVVMLRIGHRTYEVHTDRMGTAVMCARSRS